MKNKQLGISVRGVMVFLLIAGAAGYFYHQQRLAEAEKNEAEQYITTPTKRGSITQTVLATGKIEAEKMVKVGAQVSGEISKLYVNIGDRLQKGAKIAEINASTQQNTRDSAEAALLSSQAALAAAKAELQQAQQNLRRQKQLLAKGATAKESVDSAQANLTSRQAAVAQAQATVRRSQLDLDNAGVNLGHTVVSAPMDGTVISVAVEQGQSINAVQDSPTVVTMAQTNKMVVKAKISETDIVNVSAGMPAYFTLFGANADRFDGVLQSIDPAPVYMSENRSSSDGAVYYYGKMTIPNPANKLRIGMTANLVITVAQVDDVLIVPLTALQTGEDGQDEVQILLDGKPQARAVTLGLQDSLNAEIVAGLSEGDEVIISQVTEESGKTPWD